MKSTQRRRLVAHDVNPILPYLDRVLYVARGQAMVGAPADVITAVLLMQRRERARTPARTPVRRA